MAKKIESVFKGFSKLSQDERWAALKSVGALTLQEIEYLKNGGVQNLNLAEKFIENVIGWFQLPLGIATNFKIDGVEHLIPMAVEETSIIAAASKTAKWIRENGEITTSTKGNLIIGQIQFPKIRDFKSFCALIELNKKSLIEKVNFEVASGLVRRGGGLHDIQVRKVSRGFEHQSMAVVHLLMDPCDAMGANIINQACEYLKAPLQELTGEKVGICILSNLVDTKLTCSEVRLKIDADLGERIEEASLFAWQDPYRAATNNKGILNGIDPILIATGNDWRAVEAGLHAYACKDGQYRSLSVWKYKNGELIGKFEGPLVVGTVGGVTTLHPTAKIALQMLEIDSASKLSRICSAVGLVQNLGALRALTTVGIIEGHMKLHLKNLAMGAGAAEAEILSVTRKLEEILVLKKRVSMAQAVEALAELRSNALN